jgi:hypothetical protein
MLLSTLKAKYVFRPHAVIASDPARTGDRLGLGTLNADRT